MSVVPDAVNTSYWTLTADELLARLTGTASGLSAAEAAERLSRYGRNEIREQPALLRLRVLWDQLRSPLLLLLVFAVMASLLTGEWLDAAIVGAIVAVTVGVGYSREYRAQGAVARLRSRLRVLARVLRDGQEVALPFSEIVPGDVVLLSAGALIPADGVLLEATDFYVNEAVLTGESFPAEKRPGQSAADEKLGAQRNRVFQGTNVRSGTARCLVVATGAATVFGEIGQRLALRPAETEFERGVRQFGDLLTRTMLVVLVLVFAVNVLLERPPVQTLLFAVALAVGLSPELLPAILNVNLARGAQMMAERGVLVRRLNAIENLGSMDVLCTDKTGTITEGIVRLDGAWDANAQPASDVLQLAAYNAALQTGLSNPLDEAILQAVSVDAAAVQKLAEIPYDFVRRRLSVVIRRGERVTLITKGAFQQMLEVCAYQADGTPLTDAVRQTLRTRYTDWSTQGIRVLAVAVREISDGVIPDRGGERDLCFAGFLTFLDRPREGVAETIAQLSRLGVAVKLITGDSRLVAQHVAAAVGLRAERVLTGRDLAEFHDEALWRAAEETDLFAEVDPHQKERIILALRKTGHVVGFLGDGVNDAPAMHAADTSLSVQTAVDVAREAADFVLLEQRLDVIRAGIEAGRRTFANTLKYVLTTMSANLGNMVSMAVASLFLPFLPLLAVQVLFNNLLSDLPAIGLADDAVDPELVGQPRRWDMRLIRRFMLEFGLLSSVFDFLTFAALLGLFGLQAELFRTGWFVESLLTELVIAVVIRTRRPFYCSRPGRLLLISTAGTAVLALLLPYLPQAGWLGFVPLPGAGMAGILVITGLYVASVEMLKVSFYRRFS